MKHVTLDKNSQLFDDCITYGSWVLQRQLSESRKYDAWSFQQIGHIFVRDSRILSDNYHYHFKTKKFSKPYMKPSWNLAISLLPCCKIPSFDFLSVQCSSFALCGWLLRLLFSVISPPLCVCVCVWGVYFFISWSTFFICFLVFRIFCTHNVLDVLLK